MRQELRDYLSETIKKMEAGEYLASEANTKKFLIEKVLSWLDYAMDDPSKVVMELPIVIKAGSKNTKEQTIHLDYAIVDSENKPRVLIEAKCLNEKISDHIDQLNSYLRNISPNADTKDLPKAGIITNGKEWAVYLPKEDNPREFNFESPYCMFTLKDILNKNAERERIKSLVNSPQLINQSSKDLLTTQIKNEMSITLKQWFKRLLTDDAFDFLDDSIFKCIVIDCCKLKPLKGTNWTAENKEQFAPEIRKALKSVISDIKDAYYLDILKSKDPSDNGPSTTGGIENSTPIPLALQIQRKLQSIYDDASLPQTLWSSNLNHDFDVNIKYNETVHYITYQIDDDNSALRDSWVIRYRGKTDIQKGLIGLSLNSDMPEDLKYYKAIPDKFVKISKGETGFLDYVPSKVQIHISSLNDFDELKELIVYCFKKAIAFWESKNQKLG